MLLLDARRTAIYANKFAKGEGADNFQYMFLARVLVGNTIVVWCLGFMLEGKRIASPIVCV